MSPKIRRSIGLPPLPQGTTFLCWKVHTELHDIYAERWITCKQWRISGHHSPKPPAHLASHRLQSRTPGFDRSGIYCLLVHRASSDLRRALQGDTETLGSPLDLYPAYRDFHARRAPEKPCLLPQRATLCVQQIHWNEMPGIGIHIDMLLSATPNQYILLPHQHLYGKLPIFRHAELRQGEECGRVCPPRRIYHYHIPPSV